MHRSLGLVLSEPKSSKSVLIPRCKPSATKGRGSGAATPLLLRKLSFALLGKFGHKFKRKEKQSKGQLECCLTDTFHTVKVKRRPPGLPIHFPFDPQEPEFISVLDMREGSSLCTGNWKEFRQGFI